MLLRESKLKKYKSACVAYMSMMLLALAVRLLFYYGLFSSFNDEIYDFLWSFIIQIFVMAGIPLVLVVYSESGNLKTVLRETGFTKPKLSLILISIAIGVLFLFATMGISYINAVVLTMLGFIYPTSSGETGGIDMFFLALLGTAVLPGVCEEILHRGILVRGFKENMRDRYTILITAIFFSLMHTQIIQTFYTFIGGLVFGILAVKGKSIYPAMIVHFCNNAMSVYLTYASANGWILGNLTDIIATKYFFVAVFVWALIVTAIGALVILYLKEAGAWNTKAKRPVGFYSQPSILHGGYNQTTPYQNADYKSAESIFYGSTPQNNVSQFNAQRQMLPLYDAYTGRLLEPRERILRQNMVYSGTVNFDIYTGSRIVKSEPKFDPNTGEPLVKPKFDPDTGKPLNVDGSAVKEVRFDPDTGKPLNVEGYDIVKEVKLDSNTAEPLAKPKFDPDTGKPLNVEGDNIKKEVRFDPNTGEPIQKDYENNEKTEILNKTMSDESAESTSKKESIKGADRVWMFSCALLGGILTVFTLIWGIVLF